MGFASLTHPIRAQHACHPAALTARSSAFYEEEQIPRIVWNDRPVEAGRRDNS